MQAKKIYRPGKYPGVEDLDFGPDGFAVWFQRDDRGNIYVMVSRRVPSAYQPKSILRTIGAVAYADISVDNKYTIAVFTGGKTVSVQVPTVFDGVLFIKSHWRLTGEE